MDNEKISLCCITGNCEGIIGSFIERFRPVADEIVIVRAIGNLKHDKSLSIALNAGCTVGSYFNEKGLRIIQSTDPTSGNTHTVEVDSSKWPHVDNVAAARNFAWEMASHAWVMWADIDDHIRPSPPMVAIRSRAHRSIRSRIIQWILPSEPWRHAAASTRFAAMRSSVGTRIALASFSHPITRMIS